MNASAIPRAQRGVAALAITLLLIFAMSLMALYANRSLLFEQRSSANQYRAARAFEAAEAGLEWATAMLNDPRGIDLQCRPNAGATSFRAQYVPESDPQTLQPQAGARPACRIGDGALNCSCPAVDTKPDLDGAAGASFAIRFSAVVDDADSVQVTATGCIRAASGCTAGASADPADSVASVIAILKRRPLLRQAPGAALTAGGNVVLQGSAALKNLDRATGGVLVEAGGTVATDPSVVLTTLPGAPAVNALLQQEPSLSGPTNAADGNDAFATFFGMTASDFRTRILVRPITGSTAVDRAGALVAAYREGFRAFHADGPLEFDATGIGSNDQPVLIVGAGSVGCAVPCAIHGLVFVDALLPDAGNGANAQLHGAVINRGDHRQSSGAILYDTATLMRLRGQTALFARVPGSWHDF